MTRRQWHALWCVLGATALLAVAVVLTRTCLAHLTPGWQLLVFLPAYLLAGWEVLCTAARNIAHGQVFDENFLMAIATLGALSIGFLPDAHPELAEENFLPLNSYEMEVNAPGPWNKFAKCN